MSRLTDNDFAQTYQIESGSGRIYTRSMMLATCTRHPLYRGLGVSRAEVAEVLDDDVWIRFRRGQIPSATAKDVINEAFTRKAVRARKAVPGDRCNYCDDRGYYRDAADQEITCEYCR